MDKTYQNPHIQQIILNLFLKILKQREDVVYFRMRQLPTMQRSNFKAKQCSMKFCLVQGYSIIIWIDSHDIWVHKKRVKPNTELQGNSKREKFIKTVRIKRYQPTERVENNSHIPNMESGRPLSTDFYSLYLKCCVVTHSKVK